MYKHLKDKAASDKISLKEKKVKNVAKILFYCWGFKDKLDKIMIVSIVEDLWP